MASFYYLPQTDDNQENTAFVWHEELALTSDNRRLPAEWESQSAILIAWPHEDTDWNYIIDECKQCYINIVKAIIDTELLIIVAPDVSIPKQELKDIDNGNILYYNIDTNDTWARDFGGITVKEGNSLKINDFKFNGWGLKFSSDKDNLITSHLFDKKAFNAVYNNHLSFVLEGGSIESDGKGTILTTTECLLSKNRNGSFSKKEIEQYLSHSLGAKRFLWLDFGALQGDDTDSHIDTLARFCDEDTIIYVKCYDANDTHYDELNKMESELKEFKTNTDKSYKLIPLPLPSPIYFDDERLPATYANFLIMNSKILVPTYNQPENDEIALKRIKIAFPNHKIVGIDCNALIKQHGSLHCVTMQFPKGVINK